MCFGSRLFSTTSSPSKAGPPLGGRVDICSSLASLVLGGRCVRLIDWAASSLKIEGRVGYDGV